MKFLSHIYVDDIFLFVEEILLECAILDIFLTYLFYKSILHCWCFLFIC